ncbi:hypothetical protein Mycsm_05193 [Mycobacterium sp. JS623]|nr:hypothetical protein Mycsm_05193 [Mycobacterium sp. JS623]
MMYKLFAASCLASIIVSAAAAPMAYAGGGNPSGTGPPSQSCQASEGLGGSTPGHSSSSPGSPFNEPGINSTNGGVGGQHYSAKSQYDVACTKGPQAPPSVTAAISDTTTAPPDATNAGTKKHNPHTG